MQDELVTRRTQTILAVRGELSKSARCQYMRFYAKADGTICCQCSEHEVMVSDGFLAAFKIV